jgi:redox-sensing transcriptional repressor
MNNEEPSLNRSTILRLSRYLRVLQKLKSLGFIKVFSNNLGDAIGVTPAVVRKDFSLINIPGNKRGGYNIDVLITEMTKVLGKRESERIIVVGCGKIGSALLEYKAFRKDGIEILAGFDLEPGQARYNGPIPIKPMEELEEFVAGNEIHVGVISVPESSAASVFDRMISAGIRGFLNFTPVELKCGERCDIHNCPIKCYVQNVNISLELENLFYLVKMNLHKHATTMPLLKR